VEIDQHFRLPNHCTCKHKVNTKSIKPNQPWPPQFLTTMVALIYRLADLRVLNS